MNKVIEFIKKPISVKTFIIVSIFVFLLMCSSLTLQEYKTTTEGWLTTKADIDYSITRYFQAPIIIFYLIFCFKKVSNLRCVCYPVKIFVNAFNIFGWYYPDIAFPALLIPYIFILLLIFMFSIFIPLSNNCDIIAFLISI